VKTLNRIFCRFSLLSKKSLKNFLNARLSRTKGNFNLRNGWEENKDSKQLSVEGKVNNSELVIIFYGVGFVVVGRKTF
jgi:hypothetical protein